MEKLSERAHYCTACDNDHRPLLEKSLAALRKARETIRALHGPVAWEIYDDNSPEMNQVNAAEKELRFLLEDEA